MQRPNSSYVRAYEANKLFHCFTDSPVIIIIIIFILIVLLYFKIGKCIVYIYTLVSTLSLLYCWSLRISPKGD